MVLTHHYSFQIEVYWHLNSYGGPGRPCLAPWKNAQIPHLRQDYLSKEQSKASKGLQCMLVLINPMQRPSLSTVSALWDLWAWLSFTKPEEAPLIEQWVTLPLSCLCLVPTQASQLASFLRAVFPYPWVPLEEDQSHHQGFWSPM